ncbi:DNA cytosine methyltransferase [Varibaculum cambriense]|uniref:DNA cytosine methyltransferase n=1 Tax=Varibaculum cambriense TaxID=184870 RepID=UPI00255239F8|nr:DNA cytosine methyltransferase [Varibaculum cambriense]MDK8274422.1 DNA cytosine methyltransferase [Varibaculum cambriense]
MVRTIAAIDLFCGAGGLSLGLRQSGINVLAGYDLDPACRYPYSHNINADFFLSDVKDVSGNQLQQIWNKHPQDVRLLAGCAPCQPFSTMRKRGQGGSSDPRWRLLEEFERLALETLPEFVTMENVPGLSASPVFSAFIAGLEKAGYHVSYSVIDLRRLGLAQSRRRLVLMASRLGAVSVPEGDLEQGDYTSVADVIGGLTPIDAGGTDGHDPLHRSARLSALNLRRIQASIPGGTWRDWEDKKLLAACHKKSSGKFYASVYGRMRWDEPAPTITTQFFNYGTGRFGHPSQDRALSLREGALLQGFPQGYSFAPGEMAATDQIGRLIGNAVPPVLGKAVGEAFQASLLAV